MINTCNAELESKDSFNQGKFLAKMYFLSHMKINNWISSKEVDFILILTIIIFTVG